MTSSLTLTQGYRQELLLNNRLQMKAPGATERAVTQTKLTKIGPCEQVRMNWKSARNLDLRQMLF